jgi:hypothetical protein
MRPRLITTFALIALTATGAGAQAVRVGTPTHPSTLGGYRPGITGDSARAIAGSRWRACDYWAARCVTRDTTVDGHAMRFWAEVDSTGTVRTVLLTGVRELLTGAQCHAMRDALITVAALMGPPTGRGRLGEPQWDGHDGLTISLFAGCARGGGFGVISIERADGPQA